MGIKVANLSSLDKLCSYLPLFTVLCLQKLPADFYSGLVLNAFGMICERVRSHNGPASTRLEHGGRTPSLNATQVFPLTYHISYGKRGCVS